jgi:hypothetical protein
MSEDPLADHQTRSRRGCFPPTSRLVPRLSGPFPHAVGDTTTRQPLDLMSPSSAWGRDPRGGWGAATRPEPPTRHGLTAGALPLPPVLVPRTARTFPHSVGGHHPAAVRSDVPQLRLGKGLTKWVGGVGTGRQINPKTTSPRGQRVRPTRQPPPQSSLGEAKRPPLSTRQRAAASRASQDIAKGALPLPVRLVPRLSGPFPHPLGDPTTRQPLDVMSPSSAGGRDPRSG